MKCVREGCFGRVHPREASLGFDHCSRLCSQVSRELDAAQGRNVDPDVWASLVEVADAVSEWQRVARTARKRAARRAYRAARSAQKEETRL